MPLAVPPVPSINAPCTNGSPSATAATPGSASASSSGTSPPCTVKWMVSAVSTSPSALRSSEHR
eukprot:7122901-Prymnesium_polylepis.1